jgi:hypothetical protein
MITFGFDSFSENISFSSVPDNLVNEQATFGYVSFGKETTFNQGE